MTDYTRDLAQALRAGAPPREIVRILRNSEPARDPVPFRMISGAVITEHAAMRALDVQYIGRPVMYGTHSATNTQDMHGTWWAPSALTAMRDSANAGLTMWLNHTYEVPESILGSAVGAELVERFDPATGQHHTDLDIATLIVPEDVNPRALRSYRAVQGGVKLGQSVGVYILDWEWQNPDGTRLADVETDWCGPLPHEDPNARLMITDVYMVESSLVGIPSNRRGWAHEAARALRRAGVLPAAGTARTIGRVSYHRGLPRGEAAALVLEQGTRAAATLLGDRPYTTLSDEERDQLAHRVIKTLKAEIELPPSERTLPDAARRDQAQRIQRIAAVGCESDHRSLYVHEQDAIDAATADTAPADDALRAVPESTGAPDAAAVGGSDSDAAPGADSAARADDATETDAERAADALEAQLFGAPESATHDAPAPKQSASGCGCCGNCKAEAASGEARGLTWENVAAYTADLSQRAVSASERVHLQSSHDHTASVLGLSCAPSGASGDGERSTSTTDVAVRVTADTAAADGALAAIRAEMSVLEARRDAMQADLAAFEAAIARAEQIGLGRPTDRAIATPTAITRGALAAMSDTEAMALIKAGVQVID